MTKILIETKINAPIERVFDLARSIDLHKNSTTGTDVIFSSVVVGEFNLQIIFCDNKSAQLI